METKTPAKTMEEWNKRYFRKMVEGYVSQHNRLQEKVKLFYTGQRVRIISTYNNQAVGTSKKPWTGRVVVIGNVWIDDGGIWFTPENDPYVYAINLNEVEYVNSSQED